MAGDVDTLLLDKTGTITIGNRRATQFVPLDDFAADEVGELAALASAADQTPEGKSIVDLYRKQHEWRRPAAAVAARLAEAFASIAFTAQTRMSGIDLPDGRRIRKGAPDAVIATRAAQNGDAARSTARNKSTPSPRKGRRRCWCAKATASPAWWCWKTFSSPAFAIASSGCGAWACAP